ncbi:hypothetical protein EJ05DRAFT_506502 [Pseudovirgaria hyperparasitica]|uniref:BTB domain-containing protein n=1 Tax=Pseudovirgaria hyperparasitica TaxID=470096 RepID=A0A6A6WKW2_9PEZI|nr:uncharacterized protein EJ05DRAFT_506502 [Pseudovirgaria hyperparasitica]KAF2762828.1 hypothetical protein EJ05DRAFT_506502 [Pseudovirgaria hyperparasitica]
MNEPSKPRYVLIASNGDAILVVGPTETRIRVETSALESASSVFRAVFSSGSSEALNFNRVEPVVIPLPEDDEDAMEALCNILHWKNDALGVVDPERALRISRVARKFECLTALKFASAQWLIPSECMSALDLVRLAAVAYCFDNNTAFSNLTHTIISTRTEAPVPSADQQREVFPREFWTLMEERHSSLRTQLTDMIFRLLRADYCRICESTSQSKVLIYLSKLQNLDILPPPATMSIAEMLGALATIDNGDRTVGECGRHHPRCAPDNQLKESISRFANEFVGICLTCVRKEDYVKAKYCQGCT